jgi:hypothetical protein
LVNHRGGGAVLRRAEARFVALAFILSKMRAVMVNTALIALATPR